MHIIKESVFYDENYFNDFIILEDTDFLGKHFSSNIYLIKNDTTCYVFKQLEDDFHYEIKKDYIMTIIGQYSVDTL